MKVKELIAKLQEFDGELEVKIEESYYGDLEVEKVESVICDSAQYVLMS